MSPSPWRLVPARSAATCCCCCLAIAMLLLKPWECLASWALRLDVQCVLSLLLPWLLLLLLPCCCCRCCCCLLLFLPYHATQRRSMHWLSLMRADAGISYHAFQRRSMHICVLYSFRNMFFGRQRCRKFLFSLPKTWSTVGGLLQVPLLQRKNAFRGWRLPAGVFFFSKKMCRVCRVACLLMFLSYSSEFSSMYMSNPCRSWLEVDKLRSWLEVDKLVELPILAAIGQREIPLTRDLCCALAETKKAIRFSPNFA